MANFLSFNQVLSLIALVGHQRTILIEGENGIGKTALHHALRKMEQFRGHFFVEPIDCTQLSDGSVWMPDIDHEKGVSRELPNERFGVHKTNQKGINGAQPVVVFLDEIAKAPQYIKNALAPVIYERRVGDYHFPDGSVVVGATNMSLEGLGDNLPAHQRNRVIVVKMRKPTMEEWTNNFAVPRKLNPSLIAFCHEYPHIFDSFVDYMPGGKYEGKDLSKLNGMIFNPKSTQTAYASPRSLHAASDLLNLMDASPGAIDDETMEAYLDGCVGVTARTAMAAFIRFGRELTSYARVLADPTNAPIHANPTAQLVQIMQFVTRVDDREQAEKVSTYVLRMRSEVQSVFTQRVSQSTSASYFVTVPAFTQMMRDHRIYLG